MIFNGNLYVIPLWLGVVGGLCIADTVALLVRAAVTALINQPR